MSRAIKFVSTFWSPCIFNIYFFRQTTLVISIICILCCSEDLAQIRQEIRQVSEQYSIKCLECAELSERLEVQSKAVQDGRRQIHDLLVR